MQADICFILVNYLPLSLNLNACILSCIVLTKVLTLFLYLMKFESLYDINPIYDKIRFGHIYKWYY